MYKHGEGEVAVDAITYFYGDASAQPVFKNFSLTIAGGKRTALVGMSGS